METERWARNSPRHRMITRKSAWRAWATGNVTLASTWLKRETPAAAPPTTRSTITSVAQKRMRLPRALTWSLLGSVLAQEPRRRRDREEGACRIYQSERRRETT